MQRYETAVRDGVLHLESDDGWLEIGAMDTIVDLIGGETYTLEYDERQQAMGWLDTDEDGTLTFEVRETIRSMDYDEEFVEEIEAVPAGETTPDGHPKRAATYADLMTAIWDSKGQL